MKEREISKVDPRCFVVRSNDLSEARYRLTVNEQKLVYLLCSKINRDDKDFCCYRFRVLDIARFLGISAHSNIYSSIHRLAKKLRKRDLLIKTNDESYLDTGWLSSSEYWVGKGCIELAFDPKLKPFLLNLKEKFVQFRLGAVTELQSVYSMRLYELCKQYQSIGKRQFSVEELKAILGVENGEYQLYKNFKSRCLLSSLREISEKTDLKVSMGEFKKGRKVIGVEFRIAGKDNGKDHSRIPVLEKHNRPDRADLSELSPAELAEAEERILESHPSFREMVNRNPNRRSEILGPMVAARLNKEASLEKNPA